MTKAAMTELRQQIDAVRREAYATGYAAAMQVILDVASRPAPKAGTTAAARVRQAAPAAPRLALAAPALPAARKETQFGKRYGRGAVPTRLSSRRS
jgi:hypothetical protein